MSQMDMGLYAFVSTDEYEKKLMLRMNGSVGEQRIDRWTDEYHRLLFEFGSSSFFFFWINI